MRQAVFTDKGVTPGGPYSQVVILNGVAYVFFARADCAGHVNCPGTFREQARQVFQNIGILLTASGSSYEQVVKVGVFLADLKYFAEMNDVYKQFSRNLSRANHHSGGFIRRYADRSRLYRGSFRKVGINRQ